MTALNELLSFQYLNIISVFISDRMRTVRLYVVLNNVD